MDPDDAPRSPLASDDAREAPEPTSPFAPEPEPPRLGIIHLMGWTFCAAIYLSTMRPFLDFAPVRPSEAFLAYVVLNSIGAGAALGGLLLWAARRYRRLPFPKHPGEYLLVVMGLEVAIHLVTFALFLTTTAGDETGKMARAINWFAIFSAGSLAASLLYFWAGRRVTIPRWRKFFFAWAAMGVLLALIMCGGLHGVWGGLYHALRLLRLVIAIVLVVIVLRDHRGGARYPWTHWVGVGAYFWASGLYLVQSLVRMR